MSNYPYSELKIVEPKFGSSLTQLIINLDYLRKKRLGGTTHVKIFFQLKEIFHMLESIASARIEGNHTTVAEYIETKIDKPKNKTEEQKQISNLEMAMDFIDENINSHIINETFIRELHKKVVEGLSPTDEGDATPGSYRMNNIKIKGASHVPPDYTKVLDYMQELNNFIGKDMLPQYDLIKIALAHHRFVWIHPFHNGNGRTVRLLTYAQLVKAGFRVREGRIINPTAIFCMDREKYNDYLSAADMGTEDNLLSWCEYVLTGLKQEIEKVDKLTSYKYLKENVLLPAIEYSQERKFITKIESDILKIAIKNDEEQTFQAHDLRSLFPNESSLYLSRQVKRLRDKKMIQRETKNSRKYLIDFGNSYILRGVMKRLDICGFLPLKNET
jgi:Fic family protein